MHAAVNHCQIEPGKMSEAIAIFRDPVAPVARQQPGNQRAILLTEPNTNKASPVGDGSRRSSDDVQRRVSEGVC